MEEGSDSWLIIGIGGVTCGGKSTLALQLRDRLPTCRVLHMDSYFHPLDSPLHTKVDGLDLLNLDTMSCVDMPRLHRQMLQITSGRIACKPASCNTFNVLVVEGFCLLEYEPIAQLCHLKYQLHLSREVCLRRRIEKFVVRPDPPGYFELCVWPEYLKSRDELLKQEGVTHLSGLRADLDNIVLNDLQAFFSIPLKDRKTN